MKGSEEKVQGQVWDLEAEKSQPIPLAAELVSKGHWLLPALLPLSAWITVYPETSELST